jgi:hypothetical protein
MPQGIAYCRMLFEDRQARDFVYLYTNPAFHAHTGLPSVVGKRISEVLPGCRESDSQLFALYARVAAGGAPENLEIFVNALQQWFAIHVSCPQPDHFVTVFEAIAERKRIESQLRLQSLVLDQIRDHVTVTDLNGVVTYVNQVEAKELQMHANAMLGKHVAALGEGPEADATQQEVVDATLAQGAWQGQVVNFRPDGSYILLELRTTLVKDDSGEAVAMVGVGTDITQRRRAETALRISEERYRTAFQTSLDSVSINRLDDGTYLDVNQAFLDTLGYTRDEIIGHTSLELDIWVDPRDRRVLVERLRRESGCGNVEALFRRRSGDLMWGLMSAALMDVEGIPCILNITRDITERKRSDQALRESQLRHELALKATNDVIWDWDIVNDAQTWNTAGQRVFGWSDIVRDPQSANWWLERVHPDDLQRIKGRFRQVLDDGPTSFWRDEYRFRRADGSYADVMDRGYIERNAQGRAVRMVGAMLDITERKQAEAELDQYRHHLEALVAERTSQLSAAKEAAEAANIAKSSFLANMSHEIRTPLNAITGMSYLIRRAGVTLQQAAQLEKIDTAGKHLLDIINTILDLSKIEAGKFNLEETDVDVRGIVANVTSMLADKAKAKSLELVVDCQQVPFALLGDPTRLQQALLNYATNAVKFTEIGAVTLRTRIEEKSADAVLLRFEVADSGIGIAAEILPRLFSAFEQADNSTTRKYGGTGLGLAITRRLAELMGGKVGADSTAGLGSTFWFTARLKKREGLQVATPRAASIDAETAIRQGFRGCRILVVDDEPTNREIAQILLEDTGLVIDTAEDGAKALAMARRTAYAAILMDMQMPRLNGLDATRRLRELAGTRDTPIIAMTANAFAEDRARCTEAGMNDFLIKPFDPDALFATLLRWLASGPDRR